MYDSYDNLWDEFVNKSMSNRTNFNSLHRSDNDSACTFIIWLEHQKF